MVQSLRKGFPGRTSGKGPTCQSRRHKRRVFNPWVRKIPWRRAWQPTPVFLETPMDRGAWWATVHRVAESDTNEVLLLLLLSLRKQARKRKVKFTKINCTNSENIKTCKSVLKTAKVLIIKEPNKWKKSF